jgi:hypothetical protein
MEVWDSHLLKNCGCPKCTDLIAALPDRPTIERTIAMMLILGKREVPGFFTTDGQTLCQVPINPPAAADAKHGMDLMQVRFLYQC